MERTRKSNQQKLNREIFIKENWTTVFIEMETYQLSVWIERVIIHHKRNRNHGLLQFGALNRTQESNQQKLSRELFIEENWTIVFKEMETYQLSVWIYFSATSLTIWIFAISYVSHLANLQVNRKLDNFLAMPIFIPGTLETFNHIISQ